MLRKMPIEYELLAEAKQFYANYGFNYIEVPWTVSADSALITTMPHKAFITNNGEWLLGSAEQSLVELALVKKLKVEQCYQTITPCFRRDVENESHTTQFMKLELFKYYDREHDENISLVNSNDHIYADAIIQESIEFRRIAYSFFNQWVFETSSSISIKYNGEYNTSDIEVNNIEVGSYGIRSYKNITWVFGTGLALPRFPYAVNKRF